MRSLRLVQQIAVVAFACSVAILAAIPTSILQRGHIPYARKLHASLGQAGFQLPSELGGLVVEQGPRYGCVYFSPPDGPPGKPLCNRQLECQRGPFTPRHSIDFAVFQLAKPDSFLLEIGSACDSGCCDLRGTTFNGRGQRLDDSLRDRLWLRLGYVGLAGAILSLLCLGLALRPRASIVWRVATIAGFVACTAWVWWNR